MDNMSLFDAIVVGIPEVFLIYLTSIVLIKGDIFKSKDFSLKLIVKILIVSTIFPLMLIIIRRNLTSIILISWISLSFVIIALKVIFGFNIRNAFVGGYLGVFILLFCEAFSMPIIDLLSTKYSGYYFDYRFIFSFPTRVLQVISLAICLKFNLRSNELLNFKWHKLSKSKKMTLYSIIILFISAHIFVINYTEIFIKIKLYNINIEEIFFNIHVFYIETIVFVIVILILLNRTILYEDYRDILNNPKKAFETLLYNSSEGELYYYISIAKNHLNFVGIDRIEKMLKKMRTSSKDFYYYIDKELELTEYNFKKIYFVLEIFLHKIMSQVRFENMIVKMELKQGIAFNLKILLNDIEKRKLIKSFEQSLDMENLKFSLTDKGAEYKIAKEKYFELDIRIPYGDMAEDEKV